MSAVDISKFQGVIGVPVFLAWAGAGIDRVIIKLGGGDSGRYQDSATVQNHANAQQAGLATDGYWFNGTTDPAGDAVFAVQIARQVGDGRIWWDVENEGGMPHWTPAQVNIAAHAAGVPSGVYMSSSVTFTADWSACTWLPLWVANYGASSKPAVGYWADNSVIMWQHTSTGHLPGYGGNLDLDTEYSSLANLTGDTELDATQAAQLTAIYNTLNPVAAQLASILTNLKDAPVDTPLTLIQIGQADGSQKWALTGAGYWVDVATAAEANQLSLRFGHQIECTDATWAAFKTASGH